MLKKMQVKFTYLPFSEGIWQMGQVEQFDCRICLDQRRTSVHCYPFDTTLSEPDPCRSRWLITERKMLLIFIFWRKKRNIKRWKANMRDILRLTMSKLNLTDFWESMTFGSHVMLMCAPSGPAKSSLKTYVCIKLPHCNLLVLCTSLIVFLIISQVLELFEQNWHLREIGSLRRIHFCVISYKGQDDYM